MAKIQDLFSWVSSLLSFISLIIILIIFFRKILSSNFTSLFILQLLFSELINNVTQLSSFFMSFINKTEKYFVFYSICYLQIAANLFANLCTFVSSSQILISIYYTIKGKINPKKNKYWKLFCLIPFNLICIATYVIWMIHMQKYQNMTYVSKKYIRIVSCTIDSNIELYFYIVYLILFIISVYYFIKSYLFLEMLKNNIRNENSLNDNLENSSATYQKAKKLQTKLLFYPIVIFIVYLCNFIGRIRYHVTEKDDTLTTILLIAVPLNIRGFLFMLCYIFTQPKFRDGLYELVTCKGVSFDKYSSFTTQQIPNVTPIEGRSEEETDE